MTTFGRDEANIHNFPVPNIEAMREHLEHLFGGYLDGLHEGRIELAWTDTRLTSDSRYPLRHARLFGTDEIEDLAQEACRLNTQPQCNVYIGAALRKPETFPGGRAKDTDFLGLTCAYVDLDDPGVAEAAKSRYQKAKPTKIVVTGREPYRRAQMWWRLSEPVIDPALSEALLKGMASILSGDSSVTNPARVMRLAGSIAWPMKLERQVELTYIAPLREPGASSYSFEQLGHLFPPDYASRTDGVHVPDGDGVSRETNVLGLAGKVNDFRDMYMLKTVEAVMIQLIGETGKCPTPQELFDVAWPQYAEHADLDKPGKGADAVAEKCSYTVRRFNEGKIRGCRSLSEALAIYARKQRERGGYEGAVSRAPVVVPVPANRPLILTDIQFTKDYNPPDYLVDGMIQKGYLYSLTGPTGHGKTPVSMLLGCKVARGAPYHGKPVTQGGVLFLAGENSDDIRARYIAMLDHEGVKVGSLPFYFIDGVIDIKVEMPRIEAEVANIPNLSLVIIDTDQAYFLGDEGNSNEQRKWFAKTLRLLLQLPGNPAALVNCHPTKNASQDNLVPIGGSAFLNEIDGNITCWTDDRTCVIKPHSTKWRGVAFEAMAFELRTVTSDQLKDTKGRPVPSVMAFPITEEGAARRGAVADDDEKVVLRLIHVDRHASFATIAKRASWMQSDGQPAKSKVDRVIERLKKSRFVFRYHGEKYRLTKKGCRHIEVKWEGEKDED